MARIGMSKEEWVRSAVFMARSHHRIVMDAKLGRLDTRLWKNGPHAAAQSFRKLRDDAMQTARVIRDMPG